MKLNKIIIFLSVFVMLFSITNVAAWSNNSFSNAQTIKNISLPGYENLSIPQNTFITNARFNISIANLSYNFYNLYFEGTNYSTGAAAKDGQGMGGNSSLILISDNVDDEVYKFDTSMNSLGTFDTAASGNGNPQGITTDGTYIYVVDQTDSLIYVYTYAGALSRTFAIDSDLANPFSSIMYYNNFIYIMNNSGDGYIDKMNLSGYNFGTVYSPPNGCAYQRAFNHNNTNIWYIGTDFGGNYCYKMFNMSWGQETDLTVGNFSFLNGGINQAHGLIYSSGYIYFGQLEDGTDSVYKLKVDKNVYENQNLNLTINNKQLFYYPGLFNQSNNRTNNFYNLINSYLSSCSYSGGYCSVPIYSNSNVSGIITFSDLLLNNFGYIQNNVTYNSNALESSSQSFILNLSYDSNFYSQVSATLYYNNTAYTSTKTGSNNNFLFSNSLITPDVSAATNISFYWTLSFYNGTTYEYYNTSIYNQSITSLAMDNCTTNTRQLFNFTIKDERLQTNLANTTVEVAFNLYSSDYSAYFLNYSASLSYNPIRICLSNTFSGNETYYLEGTVSYLASGYAKEYYNFRNYSITNSTFATAIILYDLNSSDSTDFKLIFTGFDYQRVSNALVYLERQYISENQFKTVELPVTDSNGETILHMVRNDQRYNIRIVKDNEILGNFVNLIAFCEDYTIGDCKIELNARDSNEALFDYYNSLGIFFSEPTYDNSSGTVSFQFTSSDGSVRDVLMAIERHNVLGNRSICNATASSSSGTLFCNIGTLGDSEIIVDIYVNSILTVTKEISLTDFDYGEIGYLVFFLGALIMIFFFHDSKEGILWSIIISAAVGVGLSLVKTDLIGLGASGLWLLIIVIIGLWKLNKDRNP